MPVEIPQSPYRLKPFSFSVTVTTAGTRVQVKSSEFLVAKLSVTGGANSTNVIYLGDSTVSSTVHGGSIATDETIDLFDLTQGGRLGVVDLSSYYIDSDGNTKTAKFTGLQFVSPV